MKPYLLLGFLGFSSLISSASAAVIFEDDFESGNMSNWTSTSTTPNPLTISTLQNVLPTVGTYSAAVDNTADRMHHNLGSEVGGAAIFTIYFYDDGGSTRVFGEVRGYSGTGLPNGGTTASGSLEQLLAIGRYNSVDAAIDGGTYNATKYQARLTFGTTAGWFNLNGAGTPNRSVGWHRFDIERLADGTSLNFYVDSVLSRSFTGAVNSAWDTVVLGSNLGTTATVAYFDGVSVSTIPEPSTLAFGIASLGLLLRCRRR